MLIRVGSRGSRLALTQAELAAAHLRAPGIEIALVPITTAGDRDRSKPFGEIGSRGVFVKELEEALLEHRIDIAVHSAKDMTSTDPEGLEVGAYVARDDPRDALCGAASIAPGMRIGTASARRKAQLLALEPTLSIEPLRGNIDTRLRKRGERGLDAIVLAACGLDRLGLAHEIGLRFDPEQLLPEAAQGALALQVRAGEAHLVAAADHEETRRRVEAERAVIAAVGGGCLAPVAAHHDGTTLTALIAAEDGAWLERRSGDDPGRARTRARVARAVRIVVTRAESQADPLAAAPRGARPRGRALPVDPGRAARRRARSIRRATTGSSSRARTARPSSHAGSPRAPARIAAIGQGTADALAAHGLHADLVPRVSTQEGLLAELPPGRVLLAAAEGARRLLVDERAADFVPLYRTVELHPPAPSGDLVLLASPSAVRAFAATGARIPAVAIGPQTAAEARALGLEVAAVAASHDVEGLLEAVSSISQ